MLACGHAAAAPARDADSLLIVDCLLPGRIQRLGNAVTYAAARRAIKTTASECRVRGGEYTESGEVTTASLMRIWLPLAKAGDVEAQTNLGEIFEKGLGGVARPELAVEWYRLAAEQGHARAQVNLGAMYERGLGVAKDPAKATEWYRRASGLGPASFLPGADAPAEVTRLRAERDALARELQSERGRAEQLKKELDAINRRLGGERGSLQQKQLELEQARGDLERRSREAEQQRQRLAAATTDRRDLDAARNELARLQRELDEQRGSVAVRDRQLATLRQSVERLQAQSSVLQARLSEVRASKGAKPSVVSASPGQRWSEAVSFGRYHALVIGSNAYKFMPRLQTAEKDAETVAGLLRERYGFKTTLLLNPDRYQLLSALNKLRETLTADDNLLIYYAGHGELDRVNDRGYWLPVDAEENSTANWIPAYQITDILNAMSAKQIMLVANSCYSGTLTRSSIARLMPA